MLWISKENNPPIYVWPDDTWLNETDGKTYEADVVNHSWKTEGKVVPFSKKTKVFPAHKENRC